MSEPADEVDVFLVIIALVIAVLALVLGNAEVGNNEDEH